MRLSTGLSVQGLRAVCEQVERYASGLQPRADELCRRLAEIGVDASVAAIDHDESGELRASIRWERRGERDFLVVADCGYAVYVEFGTGVVGIPGAAGERPAWASPPTGRTTRARPDGSWVYFDAKQGRFRVTSGQAPQGFMAQGAEEVRRAIVQTAREVFAG